MPTQELFPIMVSTVLWGSSWKNLRMIVFCDNEPTVKMLNKGYTSREPAASMLRQIMSQCMSHNFTLKAHHIPGIKNILADPLSRCRFDLFFEACPTAGCNMTPIPPELLNFGAEG